MKKILLIASLISVSLINGQLLMNRNYNSLTIGNIGSNIAGGTTGQGAMFTEFANGAVPTTSNNAAASNGQIVANDAAHTNVLQFVGPNGDKGTRYVWEDGLPTLWSTRISANNIIELEIELYTGAGGGSSKNQVGISLYGNAYSIIPVGFTFNPNTLVFSGQAYYATDINMASTYGVYNISLGSQAVPNFTLPPNTWVKIGISYNTATRVIKWKTSNGLNAGFTGVKQATFDPMGVNPPVFADISPLEIDYFLVSGSVAAVTGPPAVAAIPNTAAASILFDNLVVRASATDTLLELPNIVASNKFSISPNPTSDFVNISSADNIGLNAVSVADINGRIIKELVYKNVTDVQVNISDLAAGMYIMSIKSDQGTATKKIVKN